jgi:hypothetical protein
LILALIACIGLIYSIRQKIFKGPVIIGGSEIPPGLLYSFALVILIPLFYLADFFGTIGWAIRMSAFLIFTHSSLFIFEEETERESKSE